MILSEAERALLAATQRERDEMRAVEIEMAEEMTLAHRPTPGVVLDMLPGLVCAQDGESWPCRRSRWAQKRRQGFLTGSLLRGNGHQPEDGQSPT